MDEETLCAIWDQQALTGRRFVSTEGVAFSILHRGHRRRNRGPDFHGVVLQPEAGEPVYGDLEIHLRAQDWWRHGHATNPAYAGVALHISLDRTVRPIQTPQGRAALSLDLRPYLPVGEWVDGGSALLAQEPCRAPAQRRPAAELLAVLDQAGDARLRRHAAAFSGRLEQVGPAQALYEGIADALGYSQNRRPFRRLAEALPYAAARRVLRQHGRLALEAALLGAAGLLPEALLAEAVPEHLARLARLRLRLGVAPALPASAWTRAGVRPPNFPVRRVAALAALLSRRPEGLPAAVLGALAVDPAPVPRPSGVAASRRLLAVFHLPAGESYWAAHADFDQRLGRPASHLVGLERAQQLTTNVALPWALALAGQRRLVWLERRVWAAYAALPATPLNQVEREVLGLLTIQAPPLRLDGRRQQGLLHLHAAGCLPRRCDACPVLRAAAAG